MLTTSQPESSAAPVSAAGLEHDAGGRSFRSALGLIVCLAVAIRVATLLLTGLVDPAGLMTLRFSENIAAGHGFVYNVGERVLGTTAPLFALLVAAGVKAGLPTIGFAKALGVAADVGLSVAMAGWLRAAGAARAGLVAAALVAVNPHLVHWAVTGTEGSLVTLGIACALFAQVARREVLAYATVGILVLLHWDTVLLAGVIAAADLHRDRRLPIRGICVFLAVLAPWVIFATLYFGNPVPVTFAAKTAVAAHFPRVSRLQHLHDILALVVPQASDWAISAAALAGLILVLAKRRTALWPGVAYYGAYWAAYAVTNLPAVAKYATPPLPVHLALASISVDWLYEQTLARRPRPWTYALAGAALLASLRPLQFMVHNARAHEHFERDLRRGVALWIKEHSARTDRVLVASRSSAGTYGYYSERPLIDAKGTLTPVTLPFWSADHVSPDFDIARALRPEWCILLSTELEDIEHGAAAVGAAWSDDYELAASFPRNRHESIQVYRRRR